MLTGNERGKLKTNFANFTILPKVGPADSKSKEEKQNQKDQKKKE